ncbi:hypothetical protein [Streptomyces sp. NPDC002054]|uniref:hypothetical protein n=1 Tax=Streptomyces sp. NPDC002054 TaxID=3154663 RepID=UPI003330B3A9
MNHSENINHDAVLRARVALLGSEALPVRQRVAAYRVLVQVSPLAYLPRLTTALVDFSTQEFAHEPVTALALRAEAVAAARLMCTMEPERSPLLVHALDHYRKQLGLMNRHTEVRAVDEEIAHLTDHRRSV